MKPEDREIERLYQEQKALETPDYWDKIEEKLANAPLEESTEADVIEFPKLGKRRTFQIAGMVAACFVAVIGYGTFLSDHSSSDSSKEMAVGEWESAADEEAVSDNACYADDVLRPSESTMAQVEEETPTAAMAENLDEEKQDNMAEDAVESEDSMQELYAEIEKKIADAGYTKPVSGEEIYNEICDEIEDKENGTYIFMSKKTDTCFFEYQVVVMDDSFNLSYLDIHDGDMVIHVDFDN